MGKKEKIGKQRRDKYYHLAKDTGYRSRASFKLIQLNRKFEFLQKSKVLIDLCAAPGGWLQVAQKFMPVSSVIIGVDLVPIRPIHNVITLQEDITTPKCRSSLSKNLKTWKADIVLHDGAPNVGKSWLHDAFEQNRLTLSALHLSCDFLVKGGWFITKVFRSKDYNSLIWVFNKLFKKVFVTKPQASRNESAEIFVVCQNYLAPNKIDPKFFDVSHVFAELKEDERKMTKNDLLKCVTKIKKAKAEGYDDGVRVLHQKLKVSEFLRSADYIDLLSKANEIVIDDDFVKNHSSTDTEILECVKDLKVLGRKELINLLGWRKHLRNELRKMKEHSNEFEDEDEISNNNFGNNENNSEKNDVYTTLKEADIVDEEAQKLKRNKRKLDREKRKLAERMKLKMVLKNDRLVEEEQDLFSLKNIRKSLQLNKLQDAELDEIEEPNESNNDLKKNNRMLYEKNFSDRNDDENEESDGSSENDDQTISEDIGFQNYDLESSSEEESNDLLVDLENKEDKLNRMTKMFFDNKIFKEFSDDHDNSENDEAIELQEIENTYFKKKRSNETKQLEKSQKLLLKEQNKNDLNDFSDSDSESATNDHSQKASNDKKQNLMNQTALTPEELAIGSIMIKSKKAKRDLLDGAWNRFIHEDDEFAPSWFRQEEEYYRKPVPVSDEFVREYDQKLKELNSRPIKKVLEAKSRKKKRALRRLEKARIKSESLTEDPNMTNAEKADHIKRIYKKATMKNNDRPKLVIAKKQYGNRRPPGVKGRYKVVDARLKKDKRKTQSNNKKVSKGMKFKKNSKMNKKQTRKN